MQTTATPLKPIQVGEPQAAEITGVCGKTLYNARRRGELGFVRVGSRVLYPIAELERWVAANQVRTIL